MKNYLVFLWTVLSIGSLFAQAYEGPYAEITNGYGAFGNHPIAEKKFDNAHLLIDDHFKHGDGGVEITIRYASDVAGPMPTVLFASGYEQYDDAIFERLLDFIASKGYCVVFTPYPIAQDYSSWETSLYKGMKQAIDENTGQNAGDLNIIDTTRLGFFGHSLGAGDIFWLGHKFYVDHEYGSNDKFLFSVAGWIGFNLTEDILANYPSDCRLRIEIWEEDDHDLTIQPPAKPGGTSPRIQYYLFHQINIPDDQKNYVKVFGGPDQNGYHYSTHHDLVTMNQYNALDYYAIFRPLDAMMDYTFGDEPAAKDLALGFDKDMGLFPDLDTDYDTFVFAYDESAYKYPCDADSNPFREQCPAAPLPVEVLEPLSARIQGRQVLLSWVTATERNNKGFDIQRSQDGVHWENIGWIAGKGNSFSSEKYKALDNAPKNGINYYRYMQTDFDGRTTESNVVSLELKGELGTVQLAPNPAFDEVTIYTNSSEQVEQVVIRTLAGKIVQVSSFSNGVVDISQLKSGVYQVLVQTKSRVVASMLVVE